MAEAPLPAPTLLVEDGEHLNVEAFYALVAHSPVGHALFSPECRFLAINESLAQMNATPVAEHIGKHIGQILHQASTDLIVPLIEKVLSTGEPVSRVDIVGRPVSGGDVGVWMASYHPVKSVSGRVLGVVATVAEASNTLRDRLVVEARDTRMRLLLEATQAVTWTAYPNGEMKAYVSAWPAFTGQTERQAEGFGWLDMVHPGERATFEKAWRNAIAEGTSLVVETRIWSQEHKAYRFCEVRAVPIWTTAGTVMEWAGLALDMHERQMAYQERARILETERLARQEAERANQVKDEFVATISHELRTPLTAIMGWADMLVRSGVDSETLDRGLKEIQAAVKRQAQMIDDLLDISRLTLGKVSLEMDEVDLVPMVRNLVEAFLPKLADRSLGLVCDLPEAPLIVIGDAVRLTQVLNNLISNSIKFTPDGGLITVRVEASQAERVVIEVSDTGEGIDPSFMPFVFERFRQADPSSNRRHDGLGLGLAIVRDLVHAHGGEVHAYSAGRGSGARFSVFLPAHESGLRAPRSRMTENERGIGERLEGLHLLLVDDDAPSLAVLRMLLEAEGACVTAVSSPDRARPLLRDLRFDCLLCDIAMPLEDGCAFIRSAIREGLLDPESTPAIAVTAYARPDDRHEAHLAGFSAFVTKPMNAETLVDAIQHLIQAKRAKPNQRT